jgi:hypothetical protein
MNQGTRHQPKRGSVVEVWIKQARDRYAMVGARSAYLALDELLTDYQQYADKGLSLLQNQNPGPDDRRDKRGRSRPIGASDENIIKAYTEEQLSQAQCAARFRIHTRTVARILERNNVAARPTGRRPGTKNAKKGKTDGLEDA